MIPLVDLTQHYQALAPALLPRLQEVLASGQYINGPYVSQFEQEFGDWLGGIPVVSCNSGTDALYLALRAFGIGPGDEVITSAFSFFASAEVISLVGATPVFVDIDPATFNLDPRQLPQAITAKTRAVIPVHLFGRPAPMTEIMAIARAAGLVVIEDCAQATGACWGGQPVGTWGDCGCFSFFPTKNLGTCGDGGAIVSRDPQVVERLRSLKNHGQTRQYQHGYIGVNSRLDALHAAILSVKLPYVREWNQRREAIALTYDKLLAGIPNLIVPSWPVGGRSVWNQYTVRVQGGLRDRLQQRLQALGISTRVYYPLPLPDQPVYQGLAAGDYPQAQRCAQEVLSLPCYPELRLEQQQEIARQIRLQLQELTLNCSPPIGVS
ncbi:MAG: DegT/DnrJ/EryC1/StrS family aminotransferase [Thermostichales cyanobacterium SZTDM-1c_bins_54]